MPRAEAGAVGTLTPFCAGGCIIGGKADRFVEGVAAPGLRPVVAAMAGAV